MEKGPLCIVIKENRVGKTENILARIMLINARCYSLNWLCWIFRMLVTYYMNELSVDRGMYAGDSTWQVSLFNTIT